MRVLLLPCAEYCNIKFYSISDIFVDKNENVYIICGRYEIAYTKGGNRLYRQIEAALKLAGMKKADLAVALGISSGTLSTKLTGKAPITMAEAKKIKQILGSPLPLEELFEPNTQP